MTSNSAPTSVAAVLRRLGTASASTLADLSATYEDLQTVLRCCELLVSDSAAGGDEIDDVVVESVWTVALLSYARCFSPREGATELTQDDLVGAFPEGDVLDWHRVLLQLRDHYADPLTNPRERFSVAVAQDALGAPSGVAITSARQPLVDELTVRQTGAIGYVLSGLVDERIAAQQKSLLAEVTAMSRAELDDLEQLDVAETDS